MAEVSSKHLYGNGQSREKREFYPTFDGGLNLSVPNESLPKNELKEALNVEFSPSTGALTVRGGLVWSGRFDDEVDFVVPVHGRKGFLVRKKGTKTVYYFQWNYIWPVSGELTGTGDLVLTAWDDEYLVASGGRLQKFITTGQPRLETISGSLDNCRSVFVRNGRVGVVYGDDTLAFSYLGDCDTWPTLNSDGDIVTNDNDPAGPQYVDIGYHDGMNIQCVIPLSKDLIIFKTPQKEPDKGTIWRLTGDFPDWAVLEVAHNTGTFSSRSIQSVGNDVFYLTVSGLASLSSVTSYGEIKTQWLDRKVNHALTSVIDETSQLWNIPVKQQLWVLPSDDEDIIWVFDYARGIWTQFEFPKRPVYAVGVDNALYVFIGRDLYNVNPGYFSDEMKDSDNNFVRTDIVAKLRLGTLLSGWQTLIKGAYASFIVYPKCSAELRLGKFKMDFNSGVDIDYINGYPNNVQDVCKDNDPLFPEAGVLTSRRRCLVRDWAITPEIEIKGGGCSISTLGLEVVEV